MPVETWRTAATVESRMTWSSWLERSTSILSVSNGWRSITMSWEMVRVDNQSDDCQHRYEHALSEEGTQSLQPKYAGTIDRGEYCSAASRLPRSAK